jgi:muramoyltetrapeptide carboxypeptidase LdcA involved in peptidoglycan recycling
VTYSGPFFSTFGMRYGLEYTIEYFDKCLMQAGSYEILPEEKWSVDAWYFDQENREFLPITGFLVLNEGEADTFVLLHGTEFFPFLQGMVLFLEEDEGVSPEVFDRFLQALIHQPGFAGVKRLVLGRFQKKSGMTREKLRRIIQSKKELQLVPLLAEADFGHTTHSLPFQSGARATSLPERKKCPSRCFAISGCFRNAFF